MRQAIRDHGARLPFLPPYSLDLNPIEQVFAKLKTLLRKSSERSAEATWKRFGSLLNAFSPDECADYLRNSGSASSQDDHPLAGTITGEPSMVQIDEALRKAYIPAAV